MSVRSVLLATVILVTTIAGPLAAGGADGDARSAARAHYREALKHFNLGEYDDALREFTASYRLLDDPAQLFNIGQCELKLGRPEAALRSYRAYLRMRPDAPNRGDVERRIDELARNNDQSAGAQQPLGIPAKAALASPPAAPATAPAALTLSLQSVPLAADPSSPTHPASESAFGGWKLWALVGAVVAGGIAIAIATTNRGLAPPDTALGTHRVFQ